jgi:resuscitation-promoting factor RpfB
MKKKITSLFRRTKYFHRHPFVVPVVTLSFLFATTAAVFVYSGGRTIQPSDTHLVQLTIDGLQEDVPTRAKTVGELLEKQGLKVREGDVVEPAADTEIYEDGFRVNYYAARPVIIEDGGRTVFTRSAASSLYSVASSAGLRLYQEDRVVREPVTEFITNGFAAEKITISRATPIALNLYGTPVTVRTHALTVGDLLKDKNIQLAEGDSVTPGVETLLSATPQVLVTRSGVQVATVEEVIAPPEQIVEDNSLSFGASVVRQKGVPGKKIVTYEISTVNGVEVGRKVMQTVVVQEPVKQVVARGKAVFIPEDKAVWMRAAGIAESDFAYVNYIISRESGWCPTKWQGQIGYCPPYYTDLHPITSGYGYGLGQATPAVKMSSFGADWQTNAVTQLRWADSYAKARTFGGYGKGWAAAYNYWVANRHW